MFSFFKKITVFISALAVFLPNLVLADKYGAGTAADVAGISDTVAGVKQLPELIGVIVGVALSLLGIVFFGFILFAGFRWMTAMGKTEEVQKAKDTIEASIVGLVIVLAAYAISKFVFDALGVK